MLKRPDPRRLLNKIGRLTRALPVLLLALLAVAQASGHPPEERVWYEVFVRSFQDSDGDGIGDLKGATQRLDYLRELGVGGIWLTPIHPSSSYHGYDVLDYFSVSPELGTLEEFTELLEEAHAREILVIMDLVINHTSAGHPWFKAAAENDADYRDYYVWRADPPDLRGTSGSTAWHSLSGAQGEEFYLGLFSPSMPDLNLTDERVTAEVREVARFWLELGVDGFRVDAIQHLLLGEGGIAANSSETLAWVKEFRDYLLEVAPAAFLVGETWTDMPAIVRYHEVAGLDISLNYPLWRALLSALQSRSASDLADLLEQEQRLYPQGAARGTFISNHDQTRPATLFSHLRRDEARLKLAAGLLLTLPGTPFIYYGEEIGMQDGPGMHDVEKRTPMRWEPTAQGRGFGFSRGEPWTLPAEELPGVNVLDQMADENSIWHAYRRLIHLRSELPALRKGDFTRVTGGPRSVLLGVREADGERQLLAANLQARPVTVNLKEIGFHPEQFVRSHEPLLAEGESGYTFSEVERTLELPPLALVLIELN